ncbi:tetratricopeptide repeat protein, partial [Okeania sp. SIO1H5]|uniref:tetratricopeptide repeat protein n=1 Tax=Okeania sp. SIO1H5 TaxID=2607777 RepID=UPI00257F447B
MWGCAQKPTSKGPEDSLTANGEEREEGSREKLPEPKDQFPIEPRVETIEKSKWLGIKSRKPFTGYQSLSGLHLGPLVTGEWILVTPQQTLQGKPNLQAISKDGERRLRIYESSGMHDEIDSLRLESALRYLFRVSGDSDQVEIDSLHFMSSFTSSLDTVKHWAVRFSSAGAMTWVLLECRREDAARGVEDFGLNWSVASNRPEVSSGTSTQNFDASLHNTIGLTYIQDSSYQEAIQHFEKAMEIAPEYLPFLENMVTMFQVQKRYIEGIHFLERRLKLVKRSAQLSGAMGSMYEARKNYKKASYWSQKAVKLDPANVEWLINLSDALWGLG